MLKKRSKKALSHVDWAMSLSIFLLYLAWFFIFVKPLFAPSQNIDTLLDILQEGVKNEIYQDVERLRILVSNDIDSEYEPIVIPFDHDWSESHIAHSADYFYIDEGRMFFLANLSATHLFQVYHPHKALLTTPLKAVFAHETVFHSGSFRAYFDDYLLDNAYFMGEQRLSGFTVEVDGNDVGRRGSFTNSTFIAKYQRSTDNINISSYVFADNSKVFMFLRPNDYQNHSVEISFSTYNFSKFYFDPVSRGLLTYGVRPNCRYYESSFLDLNDGSSGLLVLFSKNVSIRLCTNETNANVLLESDIAAGEEDSLFIVLHDGDETGVLSYPIQPVVGVTETLSTISSKKVSLLKNRDYDYLKQLFSYPKDRDFNITVSGDAVYASVGAEQPVMEDIYARKVEGFVLDENYNQHRVTITLTVW